MQSLRFAPKSPLLLLEVPDEHFLTELGFDPKTDLLTTHTPPRFGAPPPPLPLSKKKEGSLM